MTSVTRSLRRALARTSLVALSSLGALLLLEGGARLAVATGAFPWRDYYAFLASRPPPYRDASYFGPGFLQEYVEGIGAVTPPGTDIVMPADREGLYLRVEANRRRTVDQPEDPVKTIHVFGGSTILGAEVPDGDTVPSRLQARVKDRSWRVENLGATSVNVRQQLARLKTVTLRAGDIVVFYDGVNDIYHAIFHDNPAGWTVESAARERASRPWFQRCMLEVYDRLYHRSVLVTYFLNPHEEERAPRHVSDEQSLRTRVRTHAARYAEAIQEAEQHCARHGAVFFHFLQPHLFTVASPTEYERTIGGTRHLVARGIEESFLAGYPALRSAVEALRARGIRSTDLSAVLDRRPEGEEYYLDFCHITERANSIVAGAIAGAILGESGL